MDMSSPDMIGVAVFMWIVVIAIGVVTFLSTLNSR